jgi:hypothetical protein
VADAWDAIHRREVAIRFTAEEFAANPDACAQRFMEPGLVYVEGDRYVSLPVRRGAPRPLRWDLSVSPSVSGNGGTR